MPTHVKYVLLRKKVDELFVMNMERAPVLFSFFCKMSKTYVAEFRTELRENKINNVLTAFAFSKIYSRFETHENTVGHTYFSLHTERFQ